MSLTLVLDEDGVLQHRGKLYQHLATFVYCFSKIVLYIPPVPVGFPRCSVFHLVPSLTDKLLSDTS